MVDDEDDLPEIAAYVDFTRKQWSRLRAATPLTLDEDDLAALRGRNEPVALEEVEDVFLPLSRLLNLRFSATRELKVVTETFLGQLHAHAPYVIGLAGSVAVGKSTIARILQALLMRWPDHPRVDLVTTDGFLYPNAQLEARGLMSRKGFPDSYDVRRLLQFLSELKAGEPVVRAPGVLAPHLRHRRRRGDRPAQPRHRHRRGAERVAGAGAAGQRGTDGGRLGLLRLHDLRGCGRRRHRAVVSRSARVAA